MCSRDSVLGPDRDHRTPRQPRNDVRPDLQDHKSYIKQRRRSLIYSLPSDLRPAVASVSGACRARRRRLRRAATARSTGGGSHSANAMWNAGLIQWRGRSGDLGGTAAPEAGEQEQEPVHLVSGDRVRAALYGQLNLTALVTRGCALQRGYCCRATREPRRHSLR